MTSYATDTDPAVQPWDWDGDRPANRQDAGAPARRAGGGAHRRGGKGKSNDNGNGRHRARRALPGAKPLLAAVALAATATTVVIGGNAVSTGPQNGRTLADPEPPAAADALTDTASGSPAAPSAAPTASAAPSATTAPSASSPGPTRLPGAGISTTPVASPTVGAPSSAPTPAGARTSAAPQAPAVPSTVPLLAPSPAAAPSRTTAPSPSTAAPTAAAPNGITATDAAGADLNAAANQVLAVINQARAAQGVAPLQMLAGLQTSANAHNHTMAGGCGLEHQCPGEPAFGDRENAAGVQWGTAGENIGDGGPVADTTAAIADMAVGLTNSMLAEQPPNDGHRRNILNPAFKHIGIELLRDSSGTVWMTQDFSD
ncbi:CAP domain-containing protein [Kitasatospora sp. NBC_01302]|uniref:CAP domain-containing protein n=1 Tax=Kitasatospora sp. NBC_01302 TaxID=2903575 RepID=UPI002E0EC19E|nr:CAP domain-containing protein [Kitasatospora sp. NBC_01302]